MIIDDFVFLVGGVETRIGSFVHLASFSSYLGRGRLTIGDFVSVSSGARLYTGIDDFSGGSLVGPGVPEPYRQPTRTFLDVGRFALIGANAVVFPGVTIGEGCAIGALSLVKEDCEPWTIYAGVPASRSRRDGATRSRSWRRACAGSSSTPTGATSPRGTAPDDGPSAERPPFLPVARPSLPELADYVALLEDLWESRLLSNFGKYALEFERRAGEPRQPRHARGRQLRHRPGALDRCARPAARQRVPRSVLHLQLHHQRPALERPRPGLRGHRSGDVQRRRRGPAAPDFSRHARGRRDARLRKPLRRSPRSEIALAPQGIRLVVDAAHAFGAESGGVRIGDPRLADYQVFSFSGTKPLTSAEGGLIAVGNGGDARKSSCCGPTGSRTTTSPASWA